MTAVPEPLDTDAVPAVSGSQVPGRHLRGGSWHWVRMPRSSVPLIAFLGAVFVLGFANRPLWHTDLWDHVNYGQRILQTGELADTEPLVPLAHEMPMVNTAWGAQTIMAAVVQTEGLGLAALQFGHAFLVAMTLAAIGWSVIHECRSVPASIVAMLAVLIVNWQQFLVIRPQLAGVCCYSVVLAILATNQLQRHWMPRLLPALFVVWANLHGSFAMGLTLMGVWAAGRILSETARLKSLTAALQSRDVRRLLLLIPVCAFATLLNPNGPSVYREILRIGGLANIQSMYEWAPLSLSMRQGQATVLVCGLLMLAVKLSHLKVAAEHLLALAVFCGLSIWSSRMLNWFAPVAGLVLGIHVAAAIRHRWPRQTAAVPIASSLRWTILNVAVCGIAFAFSNLGVQTLGGSTIPPERLLSAQTPISATRFLLAHDDAKSGICLVPAEWAGYISYESKHKIQTFINLHVHLMPEPLWADYLRIIGGDAASTGLLNDYGVNTVVADRSRQGRLIQRLRDDNEYFLLYQDDVALIFGRTDKDASRR